MDQEIKDWIDKASYEDLLRKWRFAPVGSPFFVGEEGNYYSKIMADKKAVDHNEAVRASKTIGWE